MGNSFILGGISIYVIILVALMQKRIGLLVNSFSVFAIPFLVSYIPLFFSRYQLSFKFMYVSVIAFSLLFVCFYFFENIKSTKINKPFFSQNKIILIFFLFILQFIATFYQLVTFLKFLNVGFLEAVTKKAPYFEEDFLKSGWSFLYRLNIPILILFEFYKEQIQDNLKKRRLVVIFQIYLVFSSFLRFNKTEPIIALLSIILSRYLRGKLRINRILVTTVFVAIFPFFINYYYFAPIENRNREYIYNVVLDNFTLYLSLQHLAFNELLKSPDKEFSGDRNFQFITSSVKKILGIPEVVARGDYVKIGDKNTNVYSYWGAYYSEFGLIGIVLSVIFLGLVLIIERVINFLPIDVLILCSLALCFFGNMFQFLIIWWQMGVLFLFVTTFKLKPIKFKL